MNWMNQFPHCYRDRNQSLKKIYNQIYVQGRDFKLPENFIRESEYHNILRALKTVNFIRPFGGGSWQAGHLMEMLNLGRLAAKLKPKELGF